MAVSRQTASWITVDRPRIELAGSNPTCKLLYYHDVMTSVPFDTYAAVKRLREAGFDEGQAEALIRAVTEAQARADLATKGDLTETHNALKADMADLRHELKQDMAALESRLIKWMFVQAIGIIGLTVTLVELLS
jgi:hypothetical protein